MVWRQPSETSLHFAFACVGPGAYDLVCGLESIPGSTLDSDEIDDLRWSYACVSPRELGWLDEMQIFLHVEAYEGAYADQRARLEHLDVLYLMRPIDRAANVPVVLAHQLSDDSAAVLEKLLVAAVGAYRKGLLHDYDPFVSGAFVTPPLPLIVKVSPDEASLDAASSRARATLRTFLEKLESPGHSTSHSVQVTLADGDVREHIWLVELTLEGADIAGTIDRAPADLRNYAVGDRVRVAIDQVRDWLYMEDGRIAGAETLRVLADRGEAPPELVRALQPPRRSWLQRLFRR